MTSTTDNRTTELRVKLNKLVIELDRLDIMLDSPASNMTLGEYEQEREKLLDGFMQAIAATLGSVTLTAEQVQETVEKHWHDLSDEYDMPEATALPEYSYDWQTITDELNSRAERTCRILENFELPYSICSECGAIQPDDFTVYYCWACGAKVRNE